MELVLFITIAWFVIAYLVTTIKREEVERSIIIYFIFYILTKSSYSILGLNLELIRITEDKVKHLAFLINGVIIVPLLIVIFINLFYRATTYKKIILSIILMLLIALSEFIKLKLQIYSYVNWNMGLMLLGNGLFVLIMLFISKYINALQMRSDHE